MHILEELYVGSSRPGERTFKQNSQYSRVIKALTKCEEKLDATLSKEQNLGKRRSQNASWRTRPSPSANRRCE